MKKKEAVKNHPNLNDLTGQVYGRLTVLRRGEDHITRSGKHMVRWICKCKCGRLALVNASNLRSGTTKSCGCYKKDIYKSRIGSTMPFAEDVIGQRYGLLTIIEETKPYRDPKGNKQRKFICQCVCGKKKTVRLNELRNGTIISCGCIKPRVYCKIIDLLSE